MTQTIDAVEVLRQIKTCIIITDQEQAIRFCNSAAEELLCLSERQLSGVQIGEVFKHSDISLDTLMHVIESGNSYRQHSVKLLLPTQEWIVADIEICNYQSDSLEGLIFSIHGQFNEHFIGHESPEFNKHMAASDLLRGLAHEIKNPLGGLRGAAQLLTMELRDNPLEEYTSVIIKEADRLLTLVDRMMAPHKVGQTKLCNIHEPIENALKLVQIEVGERINLNRNYDPSIPDFLIAQDSLEQVFLNLFQNAAQAISDRGEIEVKSRVITNMLLGETHYPLVVRINVMDSGPGVPKKLKKNLFLPMVSGRPDGSGLGLALAQTMVQQHKGIIEYRDDMNRTTFSVYLPIISSESE